MRDDPVLKEFGARVRRLAKARGLTQTDIARLVGVDTGRVAHWWRGENGPTIRHLLPLADALGVSVDELFGRAARPRSWARFEDFQKAIQEYAEKYHAHHDAHARAD